MMSVCPSLHLSVCNVGGSWSHIVKQKVEISTRDDRSVSWPAIAYLHVEVDNSAKYRAHAHNKEQFFLTYSLCVHMLNITAFHCTTRCDLPFSMLFAGVSTYLKLG